MPTTITAPDPGLVNITDTFGGPANFDMTVVPHSMRVKVGKAILTVAAADGELSETEWQRFLAMATQFGTTAQDFEGFDPMNAEIEDHFDEETRPAARVILHDAIRVARADGYGPQERDAARRGAALLGVPEETVRAIEGILEVEDALNRARALIVAPS